MKTYNVEMRASLNLKIHAETEEEAVEAAHEWAGSWGKPDWRFDSLEEVKQ